jgi:hypothetical protein
MLCFEDRQNVVGVIFNYVVIDMAAPRGDLWDAPQYKRSACFPPAVFCGVQLRQSPTRD